MKVWVLYDSVGDNNYFTFSTHEKLIEKLIMLLSNDPYVVDEFLTTDQNNPPNEDAARFEAWARAWLKDDDSAFEDEGYFIIETTLDA